MNMLSEAYLKSRIGMSGESDLPSWLMRGEYRGMGRGAILNGLEEKARDRRSIGRIWRSPKRKEVRS